MQWDEFLRQEAATHELSPEQTAAFIVRLQVENSGKGEAKLASEIDISADAFKKHMTQVYGKFAQSCPQLASPKRGKLEKLKAYLTAKYNGKGIPRTQTTKEIHHNIPFSGVVEFVGREAELENLHHLLQENQQVAVAAIVGMGGVGKTELALQYANLHRVTYQGGICWLSALQDVGLQLVQFARNQLQLNPPDDLDLLGRVQYCLTKWHQGEVLLVIDNVTNYREEVRCYLESVPSRFKQLITTREKLQLPIVRLDLDVLTPLAAMQLLKSLVGEERLRREALIARRLCKWLGYLPLGLELVGRYLLGDEELSLTEMLRDLENERLKNPALDEAQPEMTDKLGVAAAFELSWRRLGENAQRLGCILSLFALAPIPWELVEGITINNEAQDWKRARRGLLQLHLLQLKGEGIYQLHPLLREFFQDKLTGLEQAEELKRSFCGVVVAVAKDIPQTPTIQQIKDITPAIPHLAEVANNLIQYVTDEDLIWFFVGNAGFYNGKGLYNQATSLLEQCRKIVEQRLGNEHPDIEILLNNLAVLYHSQSRYSESELLFQQILALKQHLLGEKHPDIAFTLNNLAEVYHSQGRYSEAEHLSLKVLALRQRLYGKEHLDVAQTLNSLAGIYFSQKRYKEAELPFLQAFLLRLSLLGEEHPDVAMSLNNLAYFYYSIGRYNKAELSYQKALALWQRLLGEEHPYFLTSLYNLVNLYSSQGKYSKAKLLSLQSVVLSIKIWKKQNPDVANSLNNLGKHYKSQGKYSQTEPLLQRALEIFEQTLGKNHPDTVYMRENLADLRDRLTSEQ
ncbi:tetratricopeptide repeat protein [Nostoc sp. 106C]|uniref:tetratricopeptide repeat protein n=1 Tax=Nostoc sp. 106C TaxID=1932667 RepID=UPI001FB6ECCB|nr:tetratricopeptide repeat protein [Nostoc sp. 106C]